MDSYVFVSSRPWKRGRCVLDVQGVARAGRVPVRRAARHLQRRRLRSAARQVSVVSLRRHRQFWQSLHSVQLTELAPTSLAWDLLGGAAFAGRLSSILYSSLASATSVVDELYTHKWIDEHARVMFVEFLLYNPTVNLFAISMLSFEFTPIGGGSADPVLIAVVLNQIFAHSYTNCNGTNLEFIRSTTIPYLFPHQPLRVSCSLRTLDPVSFPFDNRRLLRVLQVARDAAGPLRGRVHVRGAGGGDRSVALPSLLHRQGAAQVAQDQDAILQGPFLLQTKTQHINLLEFEEHTLKNDV